MKAVAYPRYKSSGAEWLGAVPETWALAPLGAHFRERKETVSDKEFPALSVTMGGVVPQLETAAKTDNGDNRKRVEPNDFVINSRSDRKGSAGVSRLRGSVSVISIVLEPRGVEPRYAHHLLRSQPFQEEFYRFGTGIVADLWSTRYSSMKQITLAMPTRVEQVQIAAYLDAQTAKIDLLIDKQERLIETLNERRQAVIRHAVTKGLDPNAPVKSTGIPWLGSVPAAWSVEAIKRRAMTGSGAGFPHEFQGVEDDEFPFHKVNVLSRADRDGVIRVRSDTVSRERAASLRAQIYPAGSLVMAKIGAALLLGRVRMLDEPCCLDNNLMCVTARPEASSRFLYWALSTVHFDWLVNPGAVPSTSEGAVGRYKLAFPSLEEQQTIAKFLDRETAQIDELAAHARKMIDILKERREALISAAVTGKIDVRGRA